MSQITLSPDSIDDLIYSARVGDLPSLQSDLSSLSVQFSVPQATIITAAIDSEPEEEGGTGSCLLHFPAANGNLEILTHLLTILSSSPDKTSVRETINHQNHSGNTPLHWAALNTHLECVKALVEAGADVTIKNKAGLDPIFLAERADWSTVDESKEQEQGDVDEVEVEVGADAGAGAGADDAGPVSKGRQVVEWLLASDKGGDLEVTMDSNSNSNSNE